MESMVKNLDNLSRKFLMYPRKSKRKDTQVPHPSGPTNIVADEAVHKELGDRLVRGGGLRCQETIENVSIQSYDPLLTRGNTLQSSEDSLKLNELMELCTTLQSTVLDLEKTKTTQANEIASLKKRVKKLKIKEVQELAKEEQEKRLEQVSTKKQKVDEDKGTAELQSLMEITPDEEEVTIDVVPLVVNSPSIVGWNRSITKERKAHSQISEKLAYQHSEISHKAKESKKYLLNADGLLLLFIDFNAVSVKVSAAR
ncbi:hypothetical protein Tco_0494100 [Tanacetum coccineum]